MVISLVATFGLSQLVTPSSVQGKAPALGLNGQGSVLIIGDSLTVGTEAFGNLSARVNALGTWTNVVMDAKVGRKASLGAGVIDKKLSVATTALVIALGTNDMISRTESWYPQYVIDLVMTQTRGLPVLWVNTEFSALGRRDWVSRSVRFNKALKKAQLRWPQLRIADWNSSFTPKSSSRFIADGVHLTVSGYKTRASFMVNALDTYGTQLVNATTTTTSSTTIFVTTTTPATTTSTSPPTTTTVP